MRKLTKSLLMTVVASAVSLSGFAQETINGYFRVINAGYQKDGLGVVNVTSPSTALPDIDEAAAATEAGSVIYINAEKVANNKEAASKYVDALENDLLVNNLRSQAVDASFAVYGPLVDYMREGFTFALQKQNDDRNWGLSEDQQAQIIEDMFEYMKMFLQPNDDGSFYLKSTTPDIEVLAKIVGEDPETLGDNFYADAIRYFDQTGNDQIKAQFVALRKRIHLGHTYYLIGGIIDTDVATYQNHVPGDSPIISFANDNKYDYVHSDVLIPEIQRAGDYAKWYLVPVDAQNPFGVKANAKMEGLDGRFYTTGYFDFPFTVSNGTRVYELTNVYAPKEWQTAEPNANDKVAYVLPSEITGTVPAHTPVVIECPSTKLTVLQPVEMPADEGNASVMKGIFFAEDFNQKAEAGVDDSETFNYYNLPLDKANVKAIKRENVRVFNRGKNTKNPLGFFKYEGKTIAANKGFIDMTDIVLAEEDAASANVVIVDAQTFADGINEVKTADNQSNVIYDIQGRIVSNPTKGLYIVNGKKVIK